MSGSWIKTCFIKEEVRYFMVYFSCEVIITKRWVIDGKITRYEALEENRQHEASIEGWNQVLQKSEHFLPHMWHLSWYVWITVSKDLWLFKANFCPMVSIKKMLDHSKMNMNHFGTFLLHMIFTFARDHIIQSTLK